MPSRDRSSQPGRCWPACWPASWLTAARRRRAMVFPCHRFLLPSCLVICNDIMAYLFGFFFGRTPLIKLSPKKTWEVRACGRGACGGGRGASLPPRLTHRLTLRAPDAHPPTLLAHAAGLSGRLWLHVGVLAGVCQLSRHPAVFLLPRRVADAVPAGCTTRRWRRQGARRCAPSVLSGLTWPPPSPHLSFAQDTDCQPPSYLTAQTYELPKQLHDIAHLVRLCQSSSLSPVPPGAAAQLGGPRRPRL